MADVKDCNFKVTFSLGAKVDGRRQRSTEAMPWFENIWCSSNQISRFYNPADEGSTF